jgi:hypothetical protein
MSRLSTLKYKQHNYETLSQRGPAAFMRTDLFKYTYLTEVFQVDLSTRLVIIRTFFELPKVLEQICLD